ncbi:MAG: hypothetical protein RL308_3423 [Bacteroidota bacterium]|jgi:hypothetical protein
MHPVAIVIPIYKNEISPFEAISLHQCFAVLGHYPIVFICPKKMELGSFHQDYSNKAEFLFLDDDNFESIITYNRMMLSVWFYSHFINYKYILIYQLDCFVFKDELMYWVGQGYSYIGAPWFLGNSSDKDVNELIGVGNGGFSLRNIEDTIRVLKSYTKIVSFKEHFYRNRLSKKKFVLLRSLKHYLVSYSFKTIHNDTFINEDKAFCSAGKRFDYFNIPDVKTAIAFAFEKQPNKLYQLNNNQLPFGCHAWYREDFPYEGNKEFWSKHIKIK